MAKGMVSIVCACAVLGLMSQALSNSNKRTDDPLGVAISPQTLLLSSVQGGSVVVHTSIPYGQVDRGSLTLDGVPASSTKADTLGHLVAYFSEAAIKAIVAPPEATLTLAGKYANGTSFAGSDTVRVVD